MKNALLICLVILFSFLGQTVHAQYGCNCNITPAFKRFLKTKKLVVQLSGNAAYDTAMAHALARYWKIMP